MKHALRFLSSVAAAVLFQTAAFSQISLTTSDLPNYFGAGKSQLTYVSSDTGFTMNVGTANNTSAQVWTIPVVSFTDSSRMDNLLPSSTPYGADFSGAAYARVLSWSDTTSSYQTYIYYNLSNDSLYYIGSATHWHHSYNGHVNDTVIVYDTTEFYAHFPMQLGDVTTTPADTINFGGGSTEVTTSTATFDAFGTLNLPIGSFQALRQTTKEVHKDYFGTTLTNSYTSYFFSWFTREGHQLEVNADTMNSGTVKITSLTVTYSVTTPVTAVKTVRDVPAGFALRQNYPNPFNPTTIINYQLPMTNYVSLKVYNILGQEVATLVNGEKSPGTYEVEFDGSKLSSGIYYYRLESGGNVQMKKMVMIK